MSARPYRGVLADDFITENNAMMAASMGLPFVRGASTGGGGGGGGGGWAWQVMLAAS